MKRHDRLVINKLPLPHLNYFLVSETCIEHISILQLKTVNRETWKKWSQIGDVSESQGQKNPSSIMGRYTTFTVRFNGLGVYGSSKKMIKTINIMTD